MQLSREKHHYERVVLIGVQLPGENDQEFEDSLKEMDQLVYTAGGIVECCFTQKRAKPDLRTFIGQGKMEEIKAYITEHEAEINLIVFDNELKPKQEQNLLTEFNIKVLDRVGVILDIFASRAQTREAKLEVECAQLEYLFPRLTHLWQHLSRLGGGIGTRGPGETQLETDRRAIQNKISFLKKEIQAIEKHREILRAGRRRKGNKIVSIIGYTNAGKSTLLQSLSKKEIYIEDKLFATLDPVIRKVYLPELKEEILFSDTVGFIKKLPHSLIKSFKSTLEEVVFADLVLHVVDAAADNCLEQIIAVYDVLAELNALNKKIITVFNKIDLLPEPNQQLQELIEQYQPALTISAMNKKGIEQLLVMVADSLK